MSKLTEIGESIEKQWNKYWEWVFTLPVTIGISLTILIVMISVIIPCAIADHTTNLVKKTRCLNSPYPRRYTNFICEEWTDGEWTKATSNNIIYYNDAASKVNK